MPAPFCNCDVVIASVPAPYCNCSITVNSAAVAAVPPSVTFCCADPNIVSTQDSGSFEALKLDEEPAALPKEKNGRGSPPMWHVTGSELDSLSA
ncbi:spindle and kinetochore-associated protein 1-like protein isoform [Sesbania bispinosa]|nr:spindle and kinetochore-associated protein 1-like protein isoform [Sesbania bispinosa]